MGLRRNRGNGDVENQLSKEIIRQRERIFPQHFFDSRIEAVHEYFEARRLKEDGGEAEAAGQGQNDSELHKTTSHPDGGDEAEDTSDSQEDSSDLSSKGSAQSCRRDSTPLE